MLRDNDVRLQELSQQYHQQMNQFIVVERIKMAHEDTKSYLHDLCRQLSEYKVAIKEAETKNTQAKIERIRTFAWYQKILPKRYMY